MNMLRIIDRKIVDYIVDRKGDWIQTYSGRQFWPIDPRDGDFFIEDIAHALSNICRYAGHCRDFYSVAQHSVLCSYFEPFDHPLEKLLHDASEAYLVDIPRPLKHDPEMKGYLRIERRLEAALATQFKLNFPWPEGVKIADDKVLSTEKRDLMNVSAIPWGQKHDPLHKIIKPWGPKKAERKFLERYYQILAFEHTAGYSRPLRHEP